MINGCTSRVKGILAIGHCIEFTPFCPCRLANLVALPRSYILILLQLCCNPFKLRITNLPEFPSGSALLYDFRSCQNGVQYLLFPVVASTKILFATLVEIYNTSQMSSFTSIRKSFPPLRETYFGMEGFVCAVFEVKKHCSSSHLFSEAKMGVIEKLFDCPRKSKKMAPSKIEKKHIWVPSKIERKKC